MLGMHNDGSRQIRHDAETFRVAEELMMLSNRAAPSPSMDKQPSITSSPSNISGFFEYTADDGILQKVKARSQRNDRTSTGMLLDHTPIQKKRQSRGAVHKSSDQGGVKQEPTEVASVHSPGIINSRCDLTHSELLKEHRLRFRRVRRRWNDEQRTKERKYLARFQVQGIPLVQHLESLTRWRRWR